MREIMAGMNPELNTHRLQNYFKNLKKIFPLIEQYGLLEPQFNALFEAILSKNLPSASAKILIPYLLPRSKISDEYIIRIIGKLSQKGVDMSMVAELLKWIIAVYDIIERKDRIRKLYPVLFHYLPYVSVRSHICHLLYYLTRKEQVTPYRVRRLNELIESERNNAEMIGLLLYYQTFDISIIVPYNVRLVNVFVFKNPCLNITTNLANIRGLWANDEMELTLDVHKSDFQLPARKKPRGSRSKKLTEEPSRTLDIIDITRIANNAENFEIAEQFYAVLENRRLQHIFLCDPNDNVIDRLSYWITQKIMDLIRWGNSKDSERQELHELLKMLVKFTRFAKTQLAAIEYILFQYLKTWNGFEFQDEIFELITYIKPGEFRELYQQVLKPLYKLYAVSDVRWKTKLILCYTEWLKNWALLDWSRHVQLSKEGETDVDYITNVFSGLTFNINYFETIQKLVEHVDRICVMGLLAENDNPLMQHGCLTFFELVSTISLQDDIPDIIIPAAALVHRSFFSTSAMAVSRMCGIIHRYKLAFEENDKKTEDWMSKHNPAYLDHFNKYMMDICNALWRNLALSNSYQDSLAFSLKELSIEKLKAICKERDIDANLVLSITHSSPLVGFSKRFMTMLEDEAKIIHQRPITAKYLKQLQKVKGKSRITINFN
ncbi:Mis6-domain-containing protein [Cokeromyces recurvatus]|uniref:Mis6-domain-containing protein n=1 Tax=Cokeromyces recurvatus TaxID=90255 RepID=UPI00221E8615|nr:Mis6-domain-containing protein [Cokeromyces recurvatus]KAI7906552.1 Mis6-domain-containing protein [Cokeromyces recurvatus]